MVRTQNTEEFEVGHGLGLKALYIMHIHQQKFKSNNTINTNVNFRDQHSPSQHIEVVFGQSKITWSLPSFFGKGGQ